jgi:hypothetical protein
VADYQLVRLAVSTTSIHNRCRFSDSLARRTFAFHACHQRLSDLPVSASGWSRGGSSFFTSSHFRFVLFM